MRRILLVALAVMAATGLPVSNAVPAASADGPGFTMRQISHRLWNEYSLNGRAYQQSSLVTDVERSAQYMVYGAQNRHAYVVSRALPDGEFGTARDVTSFVGECLTAPCQPHEKVLRADSHHALSTGVDPTGRCMSLATRTFSNCVVLDPPRTAISRRGVRQVVSIVSTFWPIRVLSTSNHRVISACSFGSVLPTKAPTSS